MLVAKVEHHVSVIITCIIKRDFIVAVKELIGLMGKLKIKSIVSIGNGLLIIICNK